VRGTPAATERDTERVVRAAAHGLLDYVQQLTRLDEMEAAAAAADEATAIAVQLRCQPLLDRAADATQSEAHITAAAGARRRTRATGTRP